MPDSPRQVAVLLSNALAHVDRVQPATVRAPVADILRAGIELCVISPSLIGKDVNHVIALAEAILASADAGQAPA